MLRKKKLCFDDISLVISGQAGQGIETASYVLMKIFKNEGLNFFSCKEYMSRVRGGINSASIRVSDKKVNAYRESIDIFVPLYKGLTKHLKDRISKNTIILGKKGDFKLKGKIIDVDFEEMAVECGGKIYANTVCCACILGLIGVKKDYLDEYLKKRFKEKGKKIIDNNLLAAELGFDRGKKIAEKIGFEHKMKKKTAIKTECFCNGSDAVALGCMAGGCDFVSAYPMTPSTGVFTFLCQQSKDFDIVCEQVEDEIGSANMALGAWFAGARAMTTTSGGGFALMTETVSLSGMIETPMVFYVSSRPGPATGVPTRTEQGDLNLLLYAGHGEFPRMIFAPGSLEEAYDLSARAFAMADKYQIPVFILSDQYLSEIYYNISKFKTKKSYRDNCFIRTKKDYLRYELNKDGLSKRGVPGFGKGLIFAGSDEHDEEGHSTEDLEMRIKMVNKRKRKAALMEKDIMAPQFIGSKSYKKLIVGFGSTYFAIKEALEKMETRDYAYLHFGQVYPISPLVKKYFKKAKKVISIENNMDGQFADLIYRELDVKVDEKILKYNGLPFSVEEIISKLK